MSTSHNFGWNPVHHVHWHSVALLSMALFLRCAAHGAAPDREYVNRLTQHLSHTLPGVTGGQLRVSVHPRCPAEQVQLSAVRSSAFGGSTLILRCAGSSALPFTASVASTLPKSERAVNKAPLLRSRTKVRLEITSQGFALVTTATTLGAGNIGDNISVRATRTNRILRAQVIDSSTVRAALGEGQQ